MQKATVFCLDSGSRVLCTHTIEFSSREDLLRQLEPELRHADLVEAWQQSVCMVRLRATRLEWRCALA